MISSTTVQPTGVLSPPAAGRLLIAIALGLAALAIPASANAQSEAVEYYGIDALGSVRVVFDANGIILGRMDYGPFGNEIAPSNGKQQNIYAGLFADEGTGFDHADAREHQPRSGRFTTVDPVSGQASDPQSWNRYAYSRNNPLVFIDPSGLQASNCTYKEVTTDTGLSVQLTCTEAAGGGGGGGGGGGSSLSGDLLWMLSNWTDRLTLTAVVESSDLVQTRGYQPSGAARVVDTVSVAAAVVTPIAVTVARAAAADVAAEEATGVGTKLLAAGLEQSSWAGDILTMRNSTPMTVYRVWGGESNQVGSWLTPQLPTSAEWAIEHLALPRGNSALYYSQVTIPPGTTFQFGGVGPLNGHGGGGVQIRLLQTIPPGNFGPPIPLPRR